MFKDCDISKMSGTRTTMLILVVPCHKFNAVSESVSTDNTDSPNRALNRNLKMLG